MCDNCAFRIDDFCPPLLGLRKQLVKRVVKAITQTGFTISACLKHCCHSGGGTSTDFTTIAVNRRGSSAAAHGIFFWPNGAYSFTLTSVKTPSSLWALILRLGHSDGHISGITTNNAGGKPIKITVERNVEIGNRHNPIRDLSTDNDPGYGIFATILSGPSTSTLTIDNSQKFSLQIME